MACLGDRGDEALAGALPSQGKERNTRAALIRMLQPPLARAERAEKTIFCHRLRSSCICIPCALPRNMSTA
ncbi:hypothetical protein HJFPF1_07784 [Paramyrothecium foliicola]|nr:hypothetical protein HJFPF1_07784 [Paramyrothecium foliicola]